MKHSEFRETLPLEILVDMVLKEAKKEQKKKWYCPDNACMNRFIHALRKVGVEEYLLDGDYIAIESELSALSLRWLNSEYARIISDHF